MRKDVKETVNNIRYFCGLVREVKGETFSMEKNHLNFTRYQPYGVVLKINPFNHPFRFCVEKIAGHHPEPIDYGNIPGCTYCSPEIASVGMTEKAAKEKGLDIKIGKFPFSASGKASAAGAKDGFVKLIFDAKYGELLGGHMIGANVTEMIAEIVAIRKLETTGEDLIKTIHPHPTMSEAVMEAAAAAYDDVIHL